MRQPGPPRVVRLHTEVFILAVLPPPQRPSLKGPGALEHKFCQVVPSPLRVSGERCSL